MTDYASIKNINKRRRAFLDDTVNYYTINNRALRPYGNGTCMYSSCSKTSPGCAIGRFLFTNIAEELDTCGNIRTVFIKNKFHLIPTWMQEMGVSFLLQVQVLHDNGPGTETYWDEKGLTPTGKDKYNEIVYKINSGEYNEITKT